KRWRDKLKEDPIKCENFKLKNKERMRNTRLKCKAEVTNGSNDVVEKRRLLERTRKRQYRQKLTEKRDAEKLDAKKKSDPYKCKQTLGKAVKKVENALPRDLDKKVKVLEILLNKFKEIPQKNI
ncbi:hypothetical protein KR074_004135, partial [Drosophila pseudoananassae]